MRRLTENFSMYSDMSTRIKALSSAKRKRARARASSVFPTPVGPLKMNEPIGRLGSFRPARLRLIARLIPVIASCWPTTCLCSSSSICSRRSVSASCSRTTGIPVQRQTMKATSSSLIEGRNVRRSFSHSSRRFRISDCWSRSRSRSSAARSKSWSRIAWSLSSAIFFRSSWRSATSGGGT